MVNRKNIIGFIILSMLIYLLVTVIKRDDYKDYRKKGIITTAKIIEANSGYKGRLEVTYVFMVGEEFVQNRRAFLELRLSAINHILNKHFPVVYLKDDFKANQLLLTPYNFKRMQMLFPDSLKWVLKYRD